MVKQKRGLSPIVATVSVVLLTLAAAGFIAGFVVPFVKDQLNEGTECVGYEDYFMFYDDFDYNCYDNISSEWWYGLSIEADSISDEKADEVVGFKLNFFKSGDSFPVTVEDGTPTTSEIWMLNSSKPSLEVPVRGGVRTYVYNGGGEVFEKIEIFPLLRSGRLCDKTDQFRIGGERCAPSVNLTVS